MGNLLKFKTKIGLQFYKYRQKYLKKPGVKLKIRKTWKYKKGVADSHLFPPGNTIWTAIKDDWAYL